MRIPSQPSQFHDADDCNIAVRNLDPSLLDLHERFQQGGMRQEGKGDVPPGPPGTDRPLHVLPRAGAAGMEFCIWLGRGRLVCVHEEQIWDN